MYVINIHGIYVMINNFYNYDKGIEIRNLDYGGYDG